MWEKKNNKLQREFKFKNFDEAFDFVTKVAEIAKKKNHHPYWWNNYNVVEIKLSTHDAGNIVTTLDYEMAEEINLVAKK